MKMEKSFQVQWSKRRNEQTVNGQELGARPALHSEEPTRFQSHTQKQQRKQPGCTYTKDH